MEKSKSLTAASVTINKEIVNIQNPTMTKTYPPPTHIIVHPSNNRARASLHDGTATSEHSEDLGKSLLDLFLHIHLLRVVLLAMLLLLVMLLLSAMLLMPTAMLLSSVIATTTTTTTALRDLTHRSTRQIDIYPPLVSLGLVLQSQLPTDLLHARLDLLHMVNAMVPLADDDMQMRLALSPSSLDALLEDILGLLDKLAMQIDRVAVDAAVRVVLAEDELGRLLVVAVHGRAVLLAFLRELVGGGAVAVLVRLVRAVEARRSLAGFLSR